MNAVLRQVVRTALLCGALGLLLYLALAFAAESPVFSAWLPPLFGAGAAALLLVLTVQDVTSAWRTGEFPSRSGRVLRDREPVWFRVLMIWQSAAIVALVALLLYCLTLVMDGLRAGAPDS